MSTPITNILAPSSSRPLFGNSKDYFQPLTFAKRYERLTIWSKIENNNSVYMDTALKILLTVPFFLIEKTALVLQESGNIAIAVANWSTKNISTKEKISQKEAFKPELDDAFSLAVKAGSVEKMEELIQAGANVNRKIHYTFYTRDCDWDCENPALIYAVRYNRLDLIRVLMKVFDQLDEDDIRSALNMAIFSYPVIVEEILRELIKRGGDVSFALDRAIDNGSIEIVKELIKQGADINRAYDKDTPLFQAVKLGRNSIVSVLLKAGANVKHVDECGRTALIMAVENQMPLVIKSLLETSAIHKAPFFGFGKSPVNYADEDGNTALIHALKKARFSTRNEYEYNTWLRSQEIISLLLETPGIDLHHANKKGETVEILIKRLKKEINSLPH